MKYLVASDIHGSSFYANKIKEIFNKENPDKTCRNNKIRKNR